MADTTPPPARKKTPSRIGRVLRFVGAAVDPRVYAHAFRLLNFYNYSHVRERRKLTLGRDARVPPTVSLSNAERIEIGAGVRIGSRCYLWAGGSRARIVIGENALFGPEVFLTAATYDFNAGTPVTKQPMDEADIVIGRDAWLGARVIVLPGVTVGDGAVIGAGAIVTKDVPPFAVAVGSPARVVAKRTVPADWPYDTGPQQ